jgi:glycosyltransferase involved in cell wall biosynthesis
MTLKVMHVVGGELNGGAAKGALNLHRALLESNVESYLVTNSRYIESNVSNIIYVSSSLRLRLLSSIYQKLNRFQVYASFTSRSSLFNSGSFGLDLSNYIGEISPDIINLHWVNGGVLNLSSLVGLNIPIVWTLRDMWAMTGGCHYSSGCQKFYSTCEKCPLLNVNSLGDYSKRNHREKSALYRKIGFSAFVGISPWISDEAKNSSLLKNQNIKTIYNSVDVDFFSNGDRKAGRKLLGLDDDAKVVLLGSVSLNSNYKGVSDLLTIAESVANSNVKVVTFGHGKIDLPNNQAVNLGFINDQSLLRDIYAAADVFLAMSKYEAFGKTIAESMSAGTPVVAYDATGPSHMIRHLIDGYLAKAYDIRDLWQGVEHLLGLDSVSMDALSRNCKGRARSFFDLKVGVNEYIALYEDIVRR